MSSPLILLVGFVWIGFLVCLGMIFWSSMVKRSKETQKAELLNPSKNPEDIMQRMQDQEMRERGQQIRERVQPMVPQLGLGSICLVLFITIIYFSQNR